MENSPTYKINSDEFHEYLKLTYGEKAEPFIEWSKQTSFTEQITPKQLDLIIHSYFSDVGLTESAFLLQIPSDVKKDLFNMLEDKKILAKIEALKCREKFQIEGSLNINPTNKP